MLKVPILEAMKKKGSVVLVILALVFFSGACQQQESKGLVLPETPSLIASPAWAVVNKPYLKAYSQASNQATIVTVFRAGDLLQISTDTMGQSEAEESWRKVLDAGSSFKVEQELWVQLRGISLYDLKAKAQLSARRLSSSTSVLDQPQ